jgi:uncharacterized protein (DUF58 family)
VVETTEAGGELRELFGWWTAVLFIFPLFLLFFLLSFSSKLRLQSSQKKR